MCLTIKCLLKEYKAEEVPYSLFFRTVIVNRGNSCELKPKKKKTFLSCAMSRFIPVFESRDCRWLITITHTSLIPLMSTKQVYKTKVPSLKNHVFLVQDFSFVTMTSYKLKASTVVNQQNKNKE